MFCSGWELLKDPIGDVTRAPLTLKDAFIFVVVVVVVETKLRRQQQTARKKKQLRKPQSVLFVLLYSRVGRFWVLRKVKLCVAPLGAK